MSYFAFSRLFFAFVLIRIVYSEYHLDEVYSYLVRIEAKAKILVCAGTILTPCTVLTSAHCVEDVEPSDMTVTLITQTGIKYNVASRVIHPEYNSSVLANDIALLKTVKKFEKPWTAVTLNKMSKDKIFPKCNLIQVVGWSDRIMKDPSRNDTDSDVGVTVEEPMKAAIKLISHENCTNLIKSFGGVFQGEEKLCGVTSEENDEEGCFTGSGGPLLCSTSQNSKKIYRRRNLPFHDIQSTPKKGTLADPIDLLEHCRKYEKKKFNREINNGVGNLQVGVVSWGKSCSKVPSVYIKTDYYYDWITHTANEMTKKCDSDPEDFNSAIPIGSRGTALTCPSIFNIMTVSMFITVLFQIL